MTATLPPPPARALPDLPPGPFTLPSTVAAPKAAVAIPRWRRRLATLGIVLLVATLFVRGYGPAGSVVVGFALLSPLEKLFRRHAQPVRRPQLRTDVLHLLFTGALSTAAAVVAIVAWFVVLLPVTHGVPNPLFGMLPPLLRAVAAFVLFELMGYVAHRAMHEVPALWRFHAVHHSSRTLDWISGARAHPVEGFIAGAIIAPPLILFGIQPGTLGVLTVVTGLWGVLLHANIRWRFRWMDGWWGTPDYHHWHHSNHPEARNKNYSAFLPVIDRLCGTYWQPRDRRPQVYGIDEPMPDGWFGQLVHPLRRRRAQPVVPVPLSLPLPSTIGMAMDARLAAVADADGVAPRRADEVDDRVLVARVAEGDRAALDALYRLHAGWLTVRLQRRCHDADAVDTAVQDAFLAVWRSAATFRGEGDVGAWLWGIALRRLIDQLRKRRPTPVDPSTVTSGVASSAEAELFAAGIGGSLAYALARLEPDLQAVMLLTAVDGLTTKEAAIVLGIPQGTVKTRLMRARLALQQGLR